MLLSRCWGNRSGTTGDSRATGLAGDSGEDACRVRSNPSKHCGNAKAARPSLWRVAFLPVALSTTTPAALISCGPASLFRQRIRRCRRSLPPATWITALAGGAAGSRWRSCRRPGRRRSVDPERTGKRISRALPWSITTRHHRADGHNPDISPAASRSAWLGERSPEASRYVWLRSVPSYPPRGAGLDGLSRLLTAENRRFNSSPMPFPAAISKTLYLTDRQLAGTGRQQTRIVWRDIYRRLVEDAPRRSRQAPGPGRDVMSDDTLRG